MFKYNIFSIINENVEQAKSYLKKNNISETDQLYTGIRTLTKGNDGYTGWLTKLAYEDYKKKRNISDNNLILNELGIVMNIIKTEKNITDLFSKKIIDLETYEEFLDEYEKAKLLYSAKQIYNEFPSRQKSLVDLKNTTIISLLSNLNKNKNKSIFIRKISSYKTKEDLIAAIKRFLNTKIQNNFDNLINYLHREELPIIVADEVDNLVIAEILNYRQCSIVGGQTSWCIARSQSTFNSYVNKANLGKQYIIYLTNLDSTDDNRVIGATFNINGYNTAHNVRDAYVSFDNLKDILEKRNFDIKKLFITKDKITDEMFQKISVKLLFNYFTQEEILNKKKLYTTNDLENFSKDVIEKYNLLDKTEISPKIMFKYSKDEIIKKKLYNRIPKSVYVSLSMFDYLKHGFKRSDFTEDVLNDVFNNLGDDSKKEYNEYFNKNITDKYFSYYRLKYTTRTEYRTDKYDFDKTKMLLEWYGITKENTTLEQLAECINWEYGSDLPKIIDYLKELGYEINVDNMEIFNFFKKSYKTHPSDVIDMLGHLKDKGLFFKNIAFDTIFPERNGYRIFFRSGYLREYEVNKIKKLIVDEKYLKKIDEIVEEGLFRLETIQCAGYYWSSRESGTLKDPDKWFEKWGSYAINIWSQGDYFNYFRDVQKTTIAIMLLLTYNNRFDLLDKVKYDFSKVQYNHIDAFTSDDVLHNLVESIADINITNHKSTFSISDDFTSQQRYNLAEWILKNILPVITGLGEYIIALLYFLYDRNALNVFIDKIKKRGNPMGLSGLHLVFAMLCEKQSYNFKDRFFYKAKIFDEMIDIKYILDRYTNGSKLLTKNDKYFIEYKIRNSYKPEIKELAMSYLRANEQKKLAKTAVKENYVFDYEKFIKRNDY